MVNLTKDLALWFQLHKRSQWDWHKWVNTMGILSSTWHLALGTWLRNKGLERRNDIFLYCSSTQLSQFFKEPRTKEMWERFFDLHGFSIFCYHCTANCVFFVLAKVQQGRKLSKCSIVSHLIFVEFYFWICLRNMLEVDLGCIFLGSRSSLILKFFFSLKLIN